MTKRFLQTVLIAAVNAAAAVALAAAPDAPCTAEQKKLLPTSSELQQLCPSEPIFKTLFREKATPRGTCELYFGAKTGFVQVTASFQTPAVPGGPKAGAEKAAQMLAAPGKTAPAVRKLAWQSIEAFQLAGMPGYFVDAGGKTLVVHVTPVMTKGPGDACVEGVVRAAAKRAEGK